MLGEKHIKEPGFCLPKIELVIPGKHTVLMSWETQDFLSSGMWSRYPLSCTSSRLWARQLWGLQNTYRVCGLGPGHFFFVCLFWNFIAVQLNGPRLCPMFSSRSVALPDSSCCGSQLTAGKQLWHCSDVSIKALLGQQKITSPSKHTWAGTHLTPECHGPCSSGFCAFHLQ